MLKNKGGCKGPHKSTNGYTAIKQARCKWWVDGCRKDEDNSIDGYGSKVGETISEVEIGQTEIETDHDYFCFRFVLLNLSLLLIHLIWLYCLLLYGGGIKWLSSLFQKKSPGVTVLYLGCVLMFFEAEVNYSKFKKNTPCDLSLYFILINYSIFKYSSSWTSNFMNKVLKTINFPTRSSFLIVTAFDLVKWIGSDNWKDSAGSNNFSFWSSAIQKLSYSASSWPFPWWVFSS